MLDRLTPKVRAFQQDTFLVDAIQKDGKSRFVCHPFTQKAIVLGRAGNVHMEVKVPNTMHDDIPIYRRKGGGCAVFLDPGNLIVSVVFPAKGYLNVQRLFTKANSWLINGLKDSGIHSI